MSTLDPLPDFDLRYLATRVISDRERSTTFVAIDPASGAGRFVKLASESARDDLAAQRAFRHEAAILRKLEREAGAGVVVPVVGEGSWQGRPYFAQPLLDGWSLAQAMRTRPAFAPRATMEVIGRSLTLLQAIHAAGVVHGDVSPENILILTGSPVAEDGRIPADCDVRLVDFEMARRIDGPENRPRGPIVGKPPYMAPEIARGEPHSPATDLYALGVVFYEMLTGERPFEAATPRDVLRLADAPVPPIPLDFEVPSAVEEVLRRLLEPDPAERTGSASEALRALRRLDDVHRWLARGAMAAPDRPDRPERITATLGAPTEGPGADPPPPAPRPTHDTPLRDEFRTVIVPPELRPSAPEPKRERTEIATANYDHRKTAVVDPEREPTEETPSESRLDENVQFTVYRPQTVRPEVWYPLLAFAHLAERPPDAPEDEPDPIEEVRRQARQVLGPRVDRFKDLTQDSGQAIPRAGEISFVPSVPGLEFNPPSRSFRWEESVHREEFRLRAVDDLHGQTARGHLSVYWGSILVADIALAIRVDREHVDPASGRDEPPVRNEARHYRKIFISYSHRDLAIVRQIEQFVQMMGDQYLRDWTHLRAGEVWSDRLRQLIDEADVFQLCWSGHSMHSDFVRQEWEYALSLRRPYFVRPSYWEDPFPRSDDPLLPPEGLNELHFQRLALAPDAPASPSDDGRAVDELGPPGSRAFEPTPEPEWPPAFGSAPEPEAWEGPYQVERVLRAGGMGAIERARHRLTGAPVAIKRIAESETQRILLAELPAIARIRHPQVVRVVDASMRGGDLFLVSDLVEGVGLAELLRERLLRPDEAVKIVANLAQVLHEVHELGYVHSDLKTASVLLALHATPLLFADDFVEYPAGAFLDWLNQEPRIAGTPAYMAPERLSGSAVRHEPRSDVYALGVILFEVLTGRCPFVPERGALAGFFSRIAGDEPPSLQSLDPRLPETLNAICLKCLRKEPKDRYPTAGALAEALGHLNLDAMEKPMQVD